MKNQGWDWEGEFEKEFMGEFCDGQGNGCYYDTAPKVIQFIYSALSHQRKELMEKKESMNYQLDDSGVVDFNPKLPVKEVKITADIKPDRPGSPGLWINIYHDGEPDEDATYAVTEEEIPAILEACKKYLKRV